jgi:D-serine dehydratase
VLGDDAHPVLVEPTCAPCCTLGLASGKLADIAVNDIGLSGRTEADGLAVGRCSRLAAPMLSALASGCATVAEAELFPAVGRILAAENVLVEPSAAAALAGLTRLLASRMGATRPRPAPAARSSCSG